MASENVIAVFHDRSKAIEASEQLLKEGIPSSNMSMLVSEQGKTKHFEIDADKTKAPEGAAYGAALTGLITGLAAAAIPGSVFVAGPIAGAFAAGGVGAAAGGLVGGLVGLGISEDEAKLVDQEVGEGSIVLAVTEDDKNRASKAKDVLKNFEAARVH